MTDQKLPYAYWLPEPDGSKQVQEAESNSVVIIGANGSGKSKLGAWIERQDFAKVHRIAAQRSLRFSERVPLKSYKEAEDFVFYGGTEDTYKREKTKRWNWGKDYTTAFIDDFNDVLAAVIAQDSESNRKYVADCKRAESSNEEKPHTRPTALDKLKNIWDAVFPQRRIDMVDSAFLAMMRGASEEDADNQSYSASQMSDGERSVLYLAAQVLCVPEDKIIIMDEPEIHLHRSLMRRLWAALERERPDCLFIYITHDVEFAAMHATAAKIWVKSFDGERWDWDFIKGSELPEQLLLDLLGNRKNVLFVEGTSDSYDVQLYSHLYPDFYVVPCGGCEQVIANTSAFRRTESLHETKAYGLIDRDYKGDETLNTLEERDVYHLEVAEVENLFLVEGLVRVAAERFSEDPDVAFSSVRAYVMGERFVKQLESQVRRATISELKRRLSAVEITHANDAAAAQSFADAMNSIDFQSEHGTQDKRFKEILEADDYDEVLRVFNDKSLASSVGHFLGVDNKAYIRKVLNLLDSDCEEKILEALRPYVPQLPTEACQPKTGSDS